MFNVEEISDPSAALEPDIALWDADLAALAQYDVDLVKSVILFADSVNLKTFRTDMQSMTEGHAFKFTAMPMRVITRFLYLSDTRDLREIEYLGIDESNLAPVEDARELFNAVTSGPENSERAMAALFEAEEKYEDGIEKVRGATRERLHERHDQLQAAELDIAVTRGVLSVNGWAVRGKDRDPRDQAWISDDVFFALGLEGILKSREFDHATVTMFEPGSQLSFSQREQMRGGIVQTKKRNHGLRPAALAASMIAFVRTFRCAHSGNT